MVEDDDVNSMYFISTLPWIKYTSLNTACRCG